MSTITDVMEFVEENDVKFIRLQFCDIFGSLKNISIMPSQLERAFTEGIRIDPSSIEGFLNIEDSDILLFPDISTLSVLPWRPQQGRVVRFLCHIRRSDKTPFEADSRMVLKCAEDKLKNEGLSLKVGARCEFYLFKINDEGQPVLIPHDIAGSCDIAPVDRGENIRREICLTLEEMGIRPEISQHEAGPGQHEIDFMADSPLKSADNFITFKTVVKTISANNGVYATFMPKPLANQYGSGLHISLSLYKDGKELSLIDEKGRDKTVEGFITGIMSKIREMTAVLNPTINSYRRFGSFQAPYFISWSHNDRSQLIRVPQFDGKCTNFELRSPDPCVNLYLALALIINAGIYGIKNSLKLPAPINESIYKGNVDIKKLDILPKDLDEALSIMEKSEFCKDVLGKVLCDKIISRKKEEWDKFVSGSKYEKGISDFEIKNYFYKY